MKTAFLLCIVSAAALVASLPRALYSQYLAFSFKANAQDGAAIYKSACLACHGADGRGAAQTLTEFERPATFPDFTACDQTTPEVNTGYKDVITNGGPARGFSEIMPAFGEALTSQQIDDVIAYLRHFCRNESWPRGELNLPLALVTEKAFPENELVLTSSVNVQGSPANETHIIHEQRFGVKNQIEIDLPIVFEDQDHTWYGGVGDMTVGVKRVMFSNLRSGAIFSLQGGFILPTGNRSRGFGSGTAAFEPFAAFDQLFRSNTFLQLQLGAELPFKTSVAPRNVFFNSAVGQSFAGKNGLGRMWSPMFEFVASRDLEDGAKTDWDVVPEMQVTLSKRQHIRANLGLRIPVSNTEGRGKQLMFYVLWDWADGKLTRGW
jgi:mono/diheme cytochrome c family protein